MSITKTRAAAALAAFTLAAVVSFAHGTVQAKTTGPGAGGSPPYRPHGAYTGSRDPSRHPGGIAGQRPSVKCYWLPTVSNGTVTGLHQVCNSVMK